MIPASGLYAYLGPSLSHDEAIRLAPEVQPLPPIRQGDLATLLEFGAPRAVLIVDGEFGQTLSVWHKEILRAIESGVRMLGASSMGALRAAEMHRYGMEGIGAVFEYYRDGWLTSDADVALLFGDASMDHRPFTWPLVNVRATIAALVAAGELDGPTATLLETTAGRVHFTERTHLALAEALAAGGMDRDRARELAELVRDRHVDQKRLDAIEALERLRTIDEHPPPRAERSPHAASHLYESMRWSDVRITRRNGSLYRYQLVDDLALHHPGFTGFLERAADRHLAVLLAEENGYEPTAEEVGRTRRTMLERLALDEETLPAWLSTNDLDTAGFADLVRQQAIVAHMRQFAVDSRLAERTRRLVIQQLQIEGEYAKAADTAARRRTLADSQPLPPHPTTVAEIGALIARMTAVSGWRPTTDLVTLARQHGFEGAPGLIVALTDAYAASVEGQERRKKVAHLLGLAGAGAGSGPAPSAPATKPGVNDGSRVHAVLESFQMSMLLVATVELGLPGALSAEPGIATATLAERLGAEIDPLGRLLAVLQAVRIVERDGDDRWRLSAEGEFLAPGHRDSLDAYARDLVTNALPAWRALPDTIRGAGRPSPGDPELYDLAISSAAGAMGLAAAVMAELDAVAKGAVVVDLGGGLGRSAEAISAARPDLHLLVAELPDTARRASDRLGALGLTERIRAISIDELGPLAGTAERCLVQRVALNLPDAEVVTLLRTARSSITDDGAVLVLDIVGDGGPVALLGDLVNLVRTGGRVRTIEEWEALIAEAGLRIEARRTARVPYSVLTLRRAEELS